MTAQVGSIYNYKDEEYSVVAQEGYIHFNPLDYGLHPTMRCTACWSGYWCEYDIKDDGIYLKNLFVHCEDDNYHDINGVSAILEMEDYTVFENRRRKVVEPRAKHMGHHVYPNLDIKIEFTGTKKILAGKDFLFEYYIHMGYQMFYSYKTLTEFIFKDGDLIEVNDCSDIAAKTREDFKKNPEKLKEAHRDPFDFVQTMFSLDYKDKAWWMR